LIRPAGLHHPGIGAWQGNKFAPTAKVNLASRWFTSHYIKVMFWMYLDIVL
jgi:hypothetical protein